MNKNDVTLSKLITLGFTKAEARIYVELLRRPATHAQLSARANINRTTLYRLVYTLQKRGIVLSHQNDEGKFLVAADPSVLEIEVVNQESRAKHQREAFGELLPGLEAIKAGLEADFTTHTYEGTEGFKRMLWHELKTSGSCLCIGLGQLEDLVGSHSWAERHRQRCIEANYVVREICNPNMTPPSFTDNPEFLERYERRIVARDQLKINYMITTYNDTVAIYHSNNGHKRGLEVISKPFAETIRSMFEHYWKIGDPL